MKHWIACFSILLLLVGCSEKRPTDDLGEIEDAVTRKDLSYDRSDPRLRASSAGVDITALPDLRPAQPTDKLVGYDSSAVEGSRISSITMSGKDSDILNGEGYFTPIPVTFAVAASSEADSLEVTTSPPPVTFRSPWNWEITNVTASVTTAPVGSDIIVDIKNGGTSIFTTPVHIDNGAKTSVGSATSIVILDGTIAFDAELTVEITQVGSSTAGTGLKVYFFGGRLN